MPEHIRALIVILALASVVFVFAKGPVTAMAMAPGDFVRRRNLWFAITLVALLAHNFWVYIVATGALLVFALPRESNKLAMFFFLLFAVPAIQEEITGLGVIQHFFAIHYYRLLALAVLLPAFLSLRARPDVERFGRTLPDKLIAGYIILNFLLMLSASTFTNTLRHGAFYAFIDVFLPYYVASRYLKNLHEFRDTLMAFVVAALVLSAIGAFEFAKQWLLYSSVQDALGVRWDYLNYLQRGETLRALGTTGHPIALGYVIAVAAAFLLYLRRSVPNPMAWGLGLILLMVGLIVPVSRGPWVGAAAMLLVFVAASPSSAMNFARLGLLVVMVAPLLLETPAGDVIIDHLPFVGTVEAGTITYRQQLLEISIQVILQNPFFGAFNFMYSPAMQELKQGQGIIDIVNTYLGVGLSSGLVGLSLFSGFFVAVGIGIFKGMRSLADRNGEHYFLGQVLLATLIGILVIIATASSITIIPVIYWSVAGLGVAYARMVAHAQAPAMAPEIGGTSRFQPAAVKIRT